MKYYTAIIHKDEDSAYGISFPDIPGCFAAADDWEDVPAKAAEALDLWFEDAPEVTPSSMGALLKRNDVRAAQADGATLITLPYIQMDGKQERANISMDRGLLRAIDATAKARSMTRSSFLASAARREMTGV